MNADKDNWLKRNAGKPFRNRFNEPARLAQKQTKSREGVLKDWYGNKLATNEIAAHRFNEKKLGEIIPNLVKDLGIEEEGIYAVVFSNWPEIAGKELMRRLFPVAVKGRCLHIETYDSATMYHMQQSFLKNTLLKKVKEVTDNKITEIRFVPRGRA